VYAIKGRAVENLDRNYKNRNIYILSDSQAAIKALYKYQITSKLVWDGLQSLIQLARHKRVQLIWVPGHEGIVGNETTDQLARTGPAPACGISIGFAKKAVRDCMERNHKKQSEYTTGLKQANGLISGPSTKRTKDLLKLNSDQLRWVLGHCHLKGHLFKMGLTDDPACERCLEEYESTTHIIRDCEAMPNLRFHTLGQFFMEPIDYYDAPINRVLHFIRSIGFIKC
jgi:hypothetical protein